MGKLAGTQTSENLARAFAGESQARNRYTFYSEYAKKEGHAVIEQEFKLIAENERAHAKVFYDLLVDGMGAPSNVNVDAGYPFELGDTLANLKAAADGEHDEHSKIYPAFADIAKQEGFPQAEAAFRMIANIEKEHEQKFKQMATELESQMLYQKKEPTQWICTNCGHIHQGTDAPGICPVCKYPQGWFEVKTK
ncbi:MAG: rubrerythrin [Eubacterium sp.]|jgi:rubrerythrin|nr:rubrerythrin [Eubacterium sp.]